MWLDCGNSSTGPAPPLAITSSTMCTQNTGEVDVPVTTRWSLKSQLYQQPTQHDRQERTWSKLLPIVWGDRRGNYLPGKPESSGCTIVTGPFNCRLASHSGMTGRRGNWGQRTLNPHPPCHYSACRTAGKYLGVRILSPGRLATRDRPMYKHDQAY